MKVSRPLKKDAETPNTELIRIKRSWQMTIPSPMRDHLNVREGDYLEAVITNKGMLLLPVRIVPKKIRKHK